MSAHSDQTNPLVVNVPHFTVTVNGKVVECQRRDRPESEIPGARHWGYRVINWRDTGGLTTDEQARVHDAMREREALRRA